MRYSLLPSFMKIGWTKIMELLLRANLWMCAIFLFRLYFWTYSHLVFKHAKISPNFCMKSRKLFQILRQSVHPSVILSFRPSFRPTQKIALLQSFGHPCVVRSLRPSGGARQYPRSGYFLVSNKSLKLRKIMVLKAILLCVRSN